MKLSSQSDIISFMPTYLHPANQAKERERFKETAQEESTWKGAERLARRRRRADASNIRSRTTGSWVHARQTAPRRIKLPR